MCEKMHQKQEFRGGQRRQVRLYQIIEVEDATRVTEGSTTWDADWRSLIYSEEIVNIVLEGLSKDVVGVCSEVARVVEESMTTLAWEGYPNFCQQWYNVWLVQLQWVHGG